MTSENYQALDYEHNTEYQFKEHKPGGIAKYATISAFLVSLSLTLIFTGLDAFDKSLHGLIIFGSLAIATLIGFTVYRKIKKAHDDAKRKNESELEDLKIKLTREIKKKYKVTGFTVIDEVETFTENGVVEIYEAWGDCKSLDGEEIFLAFELNNNELEIILDDLDEEYTEEELEYLIDEEFVASLLR